MTLTVTDVYFVIKLYFAIVKPLKVTIYVILSYVLYFRHQREHFLRFMMALTYKYQFFSKCE
jgi:hypothetical protein